jgi:hypothetical protein
MTMVRDPRIDVFRGLALLIIFIDHVPGNMWSHYTLGNFGLSDAAEGFVLLSGMSAGLAYGHYFRNPPRIWVGLGRIWARVWTLYLVHILVTMTALAIAAGLALVFDRPQGFTINQVNVVMAEPLQFLFRLPLLAFHLDYGDILPLYVVLLAFAPLAIWLGQRMPLFLLGLSVLLWLAAGRFALNLPNYPHDIGWFFNPLSWQLIFVLGLLTGIAAQDGRRFVPVRRGLQVLAAMILIFALVWRMHAGFGEWMSGLFWQAREDGWPGYLVSFEKTYLPLPRIVHAVALAYLLSSFAFVRRICSTWICAPFALLGKQALPVFALGSVLVYLLQNIRVGTEIDVMRDTWMLAAGIAALFALAASRQFWPKA